MTFWKLDLTIFIISCRRLLHCNCQIHLCIRSFKHTREYRWHAVHINWWLNSIHSWYLHLNMSMCVNILSQRECVCVLGMREEIRENNFEFRLRLKSWCNHIAPQELNELALICIPGCCIFHSITEYNYDIADTSYYNRTWYNDCVAYIIYSCEQLGERVLVRAFILPCWEYTA